MEHLRAGMDRIGGGPPPFSKAERSRLLQVLNGALVGWSEIPYAAPGILLIRSSRIRMNVEHVLGQENNLRP